MIIVHHRKSWRQNSFSINENLITGRFDAVFQDENSYTIIDFKTARKPKEEKYIDRIKSIRSQEDEEKILEEVMGEATVKVEKSDKLTSVVNLLAAESK